MIRTKTITTDKATVLSVELPEGANRITVFNDKDRPYISYFVGVETKRHYLPEGTWQRLGLLPEITEEQASELVDSADYDDSKKLYVNYVNKRWTAFALNSLSSLLQVNDILFDVGNTYIAHELGETSATEHLERTLDVLDRKSKVWDKERCYLFIKVD